MTSTFEQVILSASIYDLLDQLTQMEVMNPDNNKFTIINMALWHWKNALGIPKHSNYHFPCLDGETRNKNQSCEKKATKI